MESAKPRPTLPHLPVRKRTFFLSRLFFDDEIGFRPFALIKIDGVVSADTVPINSRGVKSERVELPLQRQHCRSFGQV
jgi:hypothetical protein